MARVVNRRPFKAIAPPLQFQVSSCDIYGGLSDTGTGSSPVTSVFPCLYYYTNVPYASSSIFFLLLEETRQEMRA